MPLPPSTRLVSRGAGANNGGLAMELGSEDRRTLRFGPLRVLNQLGQPASADYRLALLRIGTASGRARGPYGRRLTVEDTQLQLLVARLLGIEAAPPTGDGALV